MDTGRKVFCAGGLEFPCVMGIINLTPDSFSDGGKHFCFESAIRCAREMIDNGAGILDLGALSSRPGASQDIAEEEEINRLRPVLEEISSWADRPLISVDTARAAVGRFALSCGAEIINDISALRRDPELAGVVAQSGAGIVLMHMQGTPETMQAAPRYNDVVAEVKEFFEERIGFCLSCGIKRSQIMLDPGIGFGKELEHNLELLAGLGELESLGIPILVGHSRKSFIGQVTGREVGGRLAGSIAAMCAGRMNGGTIFRVHDVKESVDALKVFDAINTINKKQ